METSRGHKTICVPFESEADYIACVANAEAFRRRLLELQGQRPELFPSGFSSGFVLHGAYESAKQHVTVRRIEMRSSGEVFQVRPSFLMPYMIARTDQVEKALFLRRFGVSFEALAYVFGRNAMYWYRATMALGRPSLVGSTIKAPERLPEHLTADEKHTKLYREKLYVATTAGSGCILGAGVAFAASADELETAYGEFAAEARELEPSYKPKSVCTDGWEGTQSAWRRLFPTICIVLCFLHSVLKIAERCVRDRQLRKAVLDRVWNVYEATTRAAFSQRIRRLGDWAQSAVPEGIVRAMILKLCSKGPRFAAAYRFDECHRTSNAVDRLMNHQDRLLYAMRYLHGTEEAARLMVRSMAMLWNFHPYGTRMRQKHTARRSPFHDVNGFEYHPNWLHNLLIAASMGAHRR